MLFGCRIIGFYKLQIARYREGTISHLEKGSRLSAWCVSSWKAVKSDEFDIGLASIGGCGGTCFYDMLPA
jgi:hypothetical protein